MEDNYTEVYTECPKCGYSYSRAEQVKCPHKFKDKLSRQLAGQEKVMEDNELSLTEIAKLLYFIRTSTSKYPEGSNWDKCQNKRLWLSNAEVVIAKGVNRDRPDRDTLDEAIDEIIKHLPISFELQTQTTVAISDLIKALFPDEKGWKERLRQEILGNEVAQLANIEQAKREERERMAKWLLEDVPFKEANKDEVMMPRFLGLTSDTLRQVLKQGKG